MCPAPIKPIVFVIPSPPCMVAGAAGVPSGVQLAAVRTEARGMGGAASCRRAPRPRFWEVDWRELVAVGQEASEFIQAGKPLPPLNDMRSRAHAATAGRGMAEGFWLVIGIALAL